MHTLKPLSDIRVPAPLPDETYTFAAQGIERSFRGLKALLGAADISKAGDRHAGLAAADEVTREAARSILASLTVEHFYTHPLTDAQGNVDSIMRVNYDVDLDAYRSIAHLTLGQLKNEFLSRPGAEVARLGRGLTGPMAAAVAKLCDIHELIFIARKINRPSKARTLLGAPGTLSSRIQPNHPTDDVRSIELQLLWSLSLGGGDALIGINPAIDTVDNISNILRHVDVVRRRTGAPTQICVLAHVKTQLGCLDQGAPVEIMFQSLAGTDATLISEFDVTVDLLDRAYQTMRERGPLAKEAKQFMYFETGQGSEYTYAKHDGIDMATLEACCYGLARRYDPFMVNNVTGFIGPETHADDREMVISNLQDHFMGKLLGVPMGMAPCFTLHAGVTNEGQQMATAMLTAAGANYYMDVCLGADRMLAYFDTSGHDVQTLREVHGKRPAAEYLEWAKGKGIFVESEGKIERGSGFGNVEALCESPRAFAELVRTTPIVPGFEVAGPRPADQVSRELRWHQAVARAAAMSELRIEELMRAAPFQLLETTAKTHAEHLGLPARGAALSAASAAALSPEQHSVVILVADGLSAEAVHANVPDLLPVLVDGLSARGISTGRPRLVKYGRVKLAEEVADRLDTRLVVYLLGERPGGDATSSRSLSAYLCLRVPEESLVDARAFSGNASIRFEYTVLSNIYAGGGLPPVEAAAVIVDKVTKILERKAAGNRLDAA
jgi:ethanolamine ammonia-lyase large subunit